MGQDMEALADHQAQSPGARARLNVLMRAERRKRIFARLREGWAYDEIARAEDLSAERIRQIVSEVLGKRVVDRGEDHAHLQLARLAPALRVAAQAVERGELKAVGPLLKVLDRLDRYQTRVVENYDYGEEDRKELLDRINMIAANLGLDDPDQQGQAAAGDASAAGGSAAGAP